MTSTTADRTVADITFTLTAPPERAFPLLCPVLEYAWIPDWACTMVHTDSGVAELGCVFLRGEGETWITTRYEPPSRIDYAIFVPGRGVGTLEFTLTRQGPPAGSGAGTTRVALHSTMTATGAPGSHRHRGAVEEQEALWALRRDQMEHYLATGTMLTA